MAAKAASLALSIRRGLPLAVMYRNPAHARNSAAAARPTFVAASRSVSKTCVICVGSAMLRLSFVQAVIRDGLSGRTCVRAASAKKVCAPETGEDGRDGDGLAFSGCIDLHAISDVDANVRDEIAGVGVRAREEDQVTRLELAAFDASGGAVLLLSGARQADAELTEHQLDQARAVEPNARIR